MTGTDDNGCVDTDSINITINALPNVSAGQDQTVCESEFITLTGTGTSLLEWNNGVIDGVPFIQTKIGSIDYILTGTDTNGCVNTDTTIISVLGAPDSTVDLIDGVMTAQAGYTYQWLDCENNMAPVNGEINQELSIDLEGTFAVVVSNGSCSDTSSCHLQDNTGVRERNNLHFSIWPNPSNGDFNLQLVNPAIVDQVKVFDATGRLITQFGEPEHSLIVLNLQEQPEGIYLVVLISGYQTKSMRIVKE